MKATALLTLLLLVLSACGARKDLIARPGTTPPAVARGADRSATANEMMSPDIQARPDRNVEPLTDSHERQTDPFSLPPSAKP